MGLFSFLSSSRPVSTDKLPKNANALRKLYYRASGNKQYAAVVTILEKLNALHGLNDNERKILSELYVSGQGCRQDLDKARELMYRSIVWSPSLHSLPQLLFLGGGSGTGYRRLYYPDYDRILSMFAGPISKRLPCSPYDQARAEHVALDFSLLRDLVYLLELGLKDVRDMEGLRGFVAAHPFDWAVRFYNAYLFADSPGYVSRENFAAIMNENSLVAMHVLQAKAGTTHGTTPSEHLRQAEENKRYYSKLLQRFEYPQQGIDEMTRDFRLKYASPMTEQEVLDTVYAEAAVMVAATRAIEEVCRQTVARMDEFR